MLSYFDYIFYRIYRFYKKKGDSHPLIQSLNFISICQVICIFTLLQIVDKVSRGEIKVSRLERNVFFTFWGGLIIAIYILNLIRYKNDNQYSNLTKRYYNSHFNQQLKTWMIFVQPVLLLAITIALLVLTKNSKI
jgi:hypothetical protein